MAALRRSFEHFREHEWARGTRRSAALKAFVADQAWWVADYADFRALHARLIPGADEKWQTIPWKVDLLEARDQAAKEGKPVFLWSMNGHPLGCT